MGRSAPYPVVPRSWPPRSDRRPRPTRWRGFAACLSGWPPAAALAVAERWRAATVPLVASWAEDEDLPARFDLQGTDDYVPWLAAPRSLDVLAELDWPRRRTELSAIPADACDRVARAIGTAVPKLARPAPTMRLVELPDSGRLDDHGARQALSVCVPVLGGRIRQFHE